MLMPVTGCLFLAAITALAGKGEAVAIAPCLLGPRVGEELGAAVNQAVVTAMNELADVRVLDRSLTAQVVREQDLTLVARAAAVLPQRVEELGAQQVLVSSVLRLPSGFLLGLRLVDVRTGEVIRSTFLQARSESRLLADCGPRVKELWRDPDPAPGSGDAEVSVDQTLLDLWQELDQPDVRQLLGPDLDRTESVYRQYTRAAQSANAAESERLARVAGVYLTDCLSLLQRALSPPEGMVYVPPGWVTMPVPGQEPRRFWLDGFFVDRCEYTCGQYARFLAATGRAEPLAWSVPTGASAALPVAGVDWYDAAAAAEWRGLELPSYPQWLRAVGGEQPRKYPWGADWRAELCNFARDPHRPVVEPVGSHPGNASGFGVLDGVGGVFEWLSTWYGPDYWAKAPERNPTGPDQGAAKLALGGSYRSGPDGCTCSSVQQLTPATRKDDLGFRCVLPLKAGPRPARSP
ncbi:MAG: SUMF1/EgtB/PvdO family nonheme iron enzyme [Planctomycetota bacterium]